MSYSEAAYSDLNVEVDVSNIFDMIGETGSSSEVEVPKQI